jgi:PPOX class probable F420-dependent enzyme
MVATLTPDQWQTINRYKVARLATIDPNNLPHNLPICFACDADSIYSPLDEKPKRVLPGQLQRVRNVDAHPDVAFLVDTYADDWNKLSWIMVRGTADFLNPGDPEHNSAVRLLRAKYAQYREMAIDQQPILRIRPTNVSSWAWAAGGAA